MLYMVFSRGKLLFGYSDHELQEKGGYDLIHPDDLTYYAAAHQERKNASYLHSLTLNEYLHWCFVLIRVVRQCVMVGFTNLPNQ